MPAMYNNAGKTGLLFLSVLSGFLLLSCHSKNVELISKRWDCDSVENLSIKGQRFTSAEDSVASTNIQTALQSLNWTFTKDNQYECRVGEKLAVGGTYQIMEDGKTLVCTPSSKNNINTYSIDKLNAFELVLTTHAGNKDIVMHFKPR